MADLTVNTLGANGGPDNGALTFEVPNAGGDRFGNTGRDLILVEQTGAATGDVQLEGVPDSCAGRDGSSLLANAINTLKIAGPLKPTQWNNGQNVDVTYPSGITGITVGVIRVPTG